MTMTHWLECLTTNLEAIPEPARKTAYALLNRPWECDQAAVLQHVPKPLGNIIVNLQRDVRRHVFPRHSLFSAARAIRTVAVDVLAPSPSGALSPLPPNRIKLVEDCIGVAKEDLARTDHHWATVSEQGKAALVNLYALTEVAVHLMAGMYERVDTNNRSLRYVVGQAWLAAHKMMWFSRYWSHQSGMSDLMLALEVSRAMQRRTAGFRNTELFRLWVGMMLDKNMGLHPAYLSKLSSSKDADLLAKLTRRSEVLCFLWLQFLVRTKSMQAEDVAAAILTDRTLVNISYAELDNAGFRREEIRDLIIESGHEVPGDQLVSADGETAIRLHNINIKHAMQVYLHPIFERSGTDIGAWFEQAYLLPFLEERLEGRFLARAGIKDDDLKYDADLIVYDQTTHLIYLCQVKHRSAVLQPYLRDELKEFQMNSAIKTALRQLRALRSNIDSKSVRDRLMGRLGKKIVEMGSVKERCRYVLLHTIENFDMCTRDGVAMYEWNTFRNLLQGMVQMVGNHAHQPSHYAIPSIDLTDLARVQSYLMEVVAKQSKHIAPHQPTPAETYDIVKDAEFVMDSREAFWLNGRPLLSMAGACVRAPLL